MIQRFFLKDSQSIAHLVEMFNTFSVFTGFKPNLTKCKIAGKGALKGVQLTVCGMKCIDLCNEDIKILGTYSETDLGECARGARNP